MSGPYQDIVQEVMNQYVKGFHCNSTPVGNFLASLPFSMAFCQNPTEYGNLVTMVLGGFFERSTFLTVLICSSNNSIKIGFFPISAYCFDYSINSMKNL